jgi:hypothetical protein
MILSGNSPYDWFRAGDKGALSPAAQRGLALFEGKAGCAPLPGDLLAFLQALTGQVAPEVSRPPELP